MFLVNKYTACYFRIIEQRKILGEPQGYSENHHIVPKCLGGTRDKLNMIRLTAKEHFICHLLLPKMVELAADQYKLATALSYLQGVRNAATAQRYSSRLYSIHKKHRSRLMTERNSGTGNPNYGKKHSAETRAKISAARKGINVNTTAMNERKRQRFLTNNPNYDPIAKAKVIAKQVKEFKLIDPQGNDIFVRNLSKWCKANGFRQSDFCLVAKGRQKTYRGWKCQQLNTSKS